MFDVLILVRGDNSSSYVDLLGMLCQKMESKYRCRFRFKAIENNKAYSSYKYYLLRPRAVYQMSDNESLIRTISNAQGVCFVSDRPLTNKVEYFELKLHNYSSRSTLEGVRIGVASKCQPQIVNGLYNGTCTIHLSKTGKLNKENRSVLPIESSVAKDGDIIGVVMDRTINEILFYKNGTLVAMGLCKPSSFKEAYAFVAMPNNIAVRIVEAYPFHTLQKPTWKAMA